MDIRKREAIRYLGYGKCAVDEKTLLLIQDSFRELELIAEPKFIYRIFDIDFREEDRIQIATMNIQSKSLCKNLRGCHQVVLFGATLGTTVDRQLRRYEISDMARAVVMQACGAAYLEEYCDEMQKKHGYLRSRFSPGYGDFSILYQKDILSLLDASKNIGLTLTEGYMLSPTKSVTAVIGIGE